jgi:hypothetical protein
MKHDDAYLELCAAHALGCLDPMDAVRLREHLATECTVCHEELTKHREAVELLGRKAGASPPAGAEARVMRRIDADAVEHAEGERTPQSVSGPSRSPAIRWMLPVAAAVLLAFAGWVAVQRGRTIGSLERQMGDLQGAFERVVAHYELEGTELSPNARGVAYIDRHDSEDPHDDELVLHVTDLAPPPENEHYEAWMVSEDEIRPLGMVRTDENGEAYTSLKGASTSQGQIHITLESGTAARQPSGKVVLKHRPVLKQP